MGSVGKMTSPDMPLSVAMAAATAAAAVVVFLGDSFDIQRRGERDREEKMEVD